MSTLSGACFFAVCVASTARSGLALLDAEDAEDAEDASTAFAPSPLLKRPESADLLHPQTTMQPISAVRIEA
jgi:hypothetical protein